MKNRACLFALLLPLSIPSFADDDDTRMLRDGVQRQIRQYQEAEAFSDGLYGFIRDLFAQQPSLRFGGGVEIFRVGAGQQV